MKKIILISLLTCFLTSLKCKKDKYPPALLPAITQTGQNTVGFNIDGNVWVPYYECGFGRAPCGKINARVGPPLAPDSGISFQFRRYHGDKTSSLTISSALVGTITSTGSKIDSVLVSFRGENSTGNGQNDFNGPFPGSKFIVTKFDQQNQIISGEFEFVVIEQNGSGKTITIKDGRFDFKFNACLCDK
jgi:hypothetical protein